MLSHSLRALAVLLSVLFLVTFSCASVSVPSGGNGIGQGVHDQLALVYENYADFAFSFNYTVSDETTAIEKVLSAEYMYALFTTVLTDKQKEEQTELRNFPVFAFGISIIYNLPEISNVTLILDRPTIVAIFTGSLTTWNDPRIQNTNPGVSLPNQGIEVVVPQNPSSITTLFTEALYKFDNTSWTEEPQNTWPSPRPSNFKSLSTNNEDDTLAQYVNKNAYTVGFAVKRTNIAFVNQEFQIINLHGNTVANNITTVQSATEDFQPASDEDLVDTLHIDFDVIDAPGANSWPITGFIYVIFNSNIKPADCIPGLGGLKLFQYSKTAPSSKTIMNSLGFVSFDFALDSCLDILGSLKCQNKKYKEYSIPTSEVSGAAQNNFVFFLVVLLPLISCVISLL